MFKDLFGKQKYVTVKTRDKSDKKDVSPDNRLWTRCKNCDEIIFNKKLKQNLMVCPKCGYHFRISARERLNIIIDEGSFKEFAQDMYSKDILSFPGYADKLEK